MKRSRATAVALLGSLLLWVVGPGCAVPEGEEGEEPRTDSGASPSDASAPPPDVVDGVAASEAGGGCTSADDCPSRVCTSGVCVPASATDGVKNAGETDIDCGGPLAPPCAPPKTCLAGRDCVSGVCKAFTCRAPTNVDRVKNGDETDVDCGGAAGPACGDGSACLRAPDCASGVCTSLRCQSASSTDGVKNGTETDVDCGGTGNPKCARGLGCATADDCATRLCVGLRCQPNTLGDGLIDGDETDVDCGGATAPSCGDGKTCREPSDCASLVCATGAGGRRCQAPTTTDGVKNGAETDVDCGGGGPPCALGRSCRAGSDCASDACNYAQKCVLGRSCTGHFGGDTCGLGEVGEAGAMHESCCATGNVTVAGAVVRLDKYQVTAGRMRVFLESVRGDVRGFIRSARAQGKVPASLMSPTWDAFLPISFEGTADPAEIADPAQHDPTLIPGIYTSVYRHLGGAIFKGNQQAATGCYVNGFGTHTYWLPPAVQLAYGDMPHEHSQDVYDTKALNCVDYLLAQSFCIWDGGRIETFEEAQAAWGPDDFPWGNSPVPKAQGSGTIQSFRFPLATDTKLRNDPAVPASLVPSLSQSIEYANFGYSYEYPARQTSDYVVFVSAPGRMRGRGPGGHADVLGNLLEVTSSILTPDPDPRLAKSRWVAQGSWEGHQYVKDYPPFQTMLLNKYGKSGIRCAHP